LGESVYHAVSLLLVSVLAHFPFAFELPDRQFQTDNPFQLRLNEVLRRIAHLPWIRRCRFMDIGQFLYIRQEPMLVLDNLEGAISMHNYVIPGRHFFAVLLCSGIPVGRDVVLVACKDSKRIHRRDLIFPLRVGAGNVTLQDAEL
jgi:hypothetical protein